MLVLILVLLAGQTAAPAYHSDNVRDYLNYLSEAEISDLQGLIEKTVAEHNLDIVIVITNDTQGKPSRDFADDYYDYNGFGAGPDHSGLLILVNMNERELWLSTTGRAIDIFTDARISAVLDAVAPFLAEGRYYTACTEFVGQVASYAGGGVPPGQYRIDTEAPNTYLSRVVRQVKSPPVYVAALAVAIIATVLASLSSKGGITTTSRTYEDNFALSVTNDNYLRESTSRVKVGGGPTGGSGGRSGGLGSSVHRGSSGRSHGGGGRKF